MFKPLPAMFATLLPLSLGLSACGDGETSTQGAAGNVTAVTQPNVASAPAATLAQGPDVCFRAIAKHLGADAKVSEINSFFSPGSAIDSSASEPEGTMTTCSVQYQNPADPRKLLSTSMNSGTGAFAPPQPVEISVMGGDAAAFRLEDYLIPLSQVNAAQLKAIMAAQDARLKGVYGRYAWSGVRLSAPGPFSEVHTLRLDVDGRLAANDIKESGYASISTDGRRITSDHLLP